MSQLLGGLGVWEELGRASSKGELASAQSPGKVATEEMCMDVSDKTLAVLVDGGVWEGAWELVEDSGSESPLNMRWALTLLEDSDNGMPGWKMKLACSVWFFMCL